MFLAALYLMTQTWEQHCLDWVWVVPRFVPEKLKAQRTYQVVECETYISLLRLTDRGESPVVAGQRGSDLHSGREEARLYRYSKVKSISWEKSSGSHCRPAFMHSASQEAGRPWLLASIQNYLSDKQHSHGSGRPWLPASLSTCGPGPYKHKCSSQVKG